MLMEVTKKRKSSGKTSAEIITITPEMATHFLERNKNNRPLRPGKVKEIADEIARGDWKFNGDTIKIDENGDVADGQHRLWAIFEAQRSVESAIVYGVERSAFATIDTNRTMRNGGDIIALNGTTRHRKHIAGALTWLLRYQSNVIVSHRAPQNKITLAMIERAFGDHPEMVRAVERVCGLRRLCNVSIAAFLYYVLANRNLDLADRMVTTLETPAGVALSDPFFKLREYFLGEPDKTKDPVVTIALCIKAANAAAAKKKIERLYWRNQGRTAEPFPELDV